MYRVGLGAEVAVLQHQPGEPENKHADCYHDFKSHVTIVAYVVMSFKSILESKQLIWFYQTRPQVCNRTYEDSVRHGLIVWPTTRLNSTSTVQCQNGGRAVRSCGRKNKWEETDWNKCNSVLTADIQYLTSNRSENPGEISDILGKLVNLTNNATLLSMQDIKSVVRYLGLNRINPLTETSTISVISNILSADPEVTKGVQLKDISRIIRTVVKISQKFCAARPVSVAFKQLTLTCAGWFNLSGQNSILEINKNSSLLHSYRQNQQFSDFIIVVEEQDQESGDTSIWNSSPIFTKMGSGCVFVDTASALANKSKCFVTGGLSCKCYHRNGIVVATTGPTMTNESQRTVRQICHTVAMAILVLTILGLLCKGSLSNPQTAINLNLATTAFLAQTTFLVQTFLVDETPIENIATEELSKSWINLNLTSKSCLIITFVSEYIHPALLGWSLTASLALLKSLDPSFVMRSQTQGNVKVAKLAILIYLLPLIFPISHWIYCAIADSASVRTCLMVRDSSVSCMGSVITVEDVRLYIHLLPIALLIIAHFVTVLGTLGVIYRFRNKAGTVESRRRIKMSFLCVIPACVLYMLYCVRATIYWQIEILTAFAVFSVAFALVFSVGVLGSMKLSYGFVQFEGHSMDRPENGSAMINLQ